MADIEVEENLQKLSNNLIDHLWRCEPKNGEDVWPISQLSLSKVPWFYRGEGNSNLVLSLPREKVILRIHKLDYNDIITVTLIEELERKLLNEIEFYRKVVISFIGTLFYFPPLLTRINEEEIIRIDRNLFSIRPAFRLAKGIRCGLVTVYPDYTYLPTFSQNNTTYCIEIKPKQGWIPLIDRKYPKCTFCMNQYLKLMKNRIFEISQYCPLDLFSGNVNRMKQAVHNLLKTPQNNLKIFKNGNLIFSEDCNKCYLEVLREFFLLNNDDEVNTEQLIDRWCSLIVNGLCLRLPKMKNTSDIFTEKVQSSKNFSKTLQYNSSMKPCDWSVQSLPENSILQRIINVQKLQNSSFKTVCTYYKEKYSTDDDYNYLKSFLKSDEPLDIIQRYLLATTAKDCSIFLAIQSVENEDLQISTNNFIIKDSEGMKYRLNLSISDIDPKPLSCIGKHMKRDRDVLDAFYHFMMRHPNKT